MVTGDSINSSYTRRTALAPITTCPPVTTTLRTSWQHILSLISQVTCGTGTQTPQHSGLENCMTPSRVCHNGLYDAATCSARPWQGLAGSGACRMPAGHSCHLTRCHRHATCMLAVDNGSDPKAPRCRMPAGLQSACNQPMQHAPTLQQP